MIYCIVFDMSMENKIIKKNFQLHAIWSFDCLQLYSRSSIVSVLLQNAHLSDSTRFIVSSSYFVAIL